MSCEHGAGFPKEIAALLPAQIASMRQQSAEKEAAARELAEEERLLELGLQAQERVRSVRCPSISHLCNLIPKETSEYCERQQASRLIGD